MNKQDKINIKRLEIDRETILYEIQQHEDELDSYITSNDLDGAFYCKTQLKYNKLDLEQIDLDVSEIKDKYPTE